jgi:hypothetical protein
MALLLGQSALADTWGHVKGMYHLGTNDSLYIDRQTKEFTRFGFDLELNKTLGVPFLYLTLAAEGSGRPHPGFTKVAGRAMISLELDSETTLFAYHRSAHNLDRSTSYPGYGFLNDNQIGIKMNFGGRNVKR